MKIWLPEELYFMRNGNLPQKKNESSFTDKTVVISGSTSGVGKATLFEFVRNGANVVMVARNESKAEQVKQEVFKKYNREIDLIIADFSDFDQVRKAANDILENYNTIDLLINSVGIHTTKRLYNKDGIEMSFCVNHLSVFLFTVLLIPRLKENPSSRIIQVNSEGHRVNGLRIKDVNFKRRLYTGLRGYGQSKVAQLFTVYELAKRLEDSGVTINAMHPGAVKSNIGGNNGFLYRFWAKYVLVHTLKDPIISAESIYYLGTSQEMKGISGKFYHLTVLEKPAWHALKVKKQQPIWELSLKMVGLPIDWEV